MTATDPQLRGIVKAFPGVRAPGGVDLLVSPGKVHALPGKKYGAGTSTLMKVLAGIYRPDEGTIHVAGQELVMATPIRTKKRGVVVIHQLPSLVPEMSAAENVHLGELPRKGPRRVAWKTLFGTVERHPAPSEVPLPGGETQASVLSVANPQKIVIG